MNKQQKPRVLFLCSANAARSQMAEALLRYHAADRFEACSAGLEPTRVHLLTIRVLEEIKVDASMLYAKGVEVYLGREAIRWAIVVCDKAQKACPQFHSLTVMCTNLYWPFDDPAAFVGDETQMLQKFRRVRDGIDQRIRQWLDEVKSS